MNRAIDCAHDCVAARVIKDFYVTSDIDWARAERYWPEEPAYRIGHWIRRPAALAQDDTPMLAVVQHALGLIAGAQEDIIVLLQPTQPFRTPQHVREAIVLLESSGADSVVSVVPLPLSQSPDLQLKILDATILIPWDGRPWPRMLTRRQDARQTYIRDGTVYAFRRRTVTEHGTIYGADVRPLVIDPADSCEMDTELDWAEAVRRWEARAPIRP